MATSSDDLTAEQLRALAARAAAFREFCDAATARGKALRWPADDELLKRFAEASERASWMAITCASRATRKERGKGKD